MIPKRIECQAEQSYGVKIEDVESVLDKDYGEAGCVDKAIDKLKQIIDNLKK